MTRLTYMNEAAGQTELHTETCGEAAQILHLKQLLVTLKQHYEKRLLAMQVELQTEQKQKAAYQNELSVAQLQIQDLEKSHDEELAALRDQLRLLKDRLKKTHEINPQNPSDSSQELKQELEEIKRTLGQGMQESHVFERRHAEVLSEKINLDHQCKQLQLQLEHQSSNLSAFQTELHEMEQAKKRAEAALRSKEIELSEYTQQQRDIQNKLARFDELMREKEYIQDKYEQLKEDWAQINEKFDETFEVRAYAEQRLIQLEARVNELEIQLQERADQLQTVLGEKEAVKSERETLKGYLEESENRLKVAQQHLAKKVKETALLNEKVSEQQNSLHEFSQTIETQKNQINQFHANAELYLKQEKRLQEQLHEALKATESQVSKWEEKYFRMYDKWQESENQIRELKKFEDKHHQMQNLLANLGSFMASSNNGSSSPFFPVQDGVERLNTQPGNFESPPTDEMSVLRAHPTASSFLGMDEHEEKFDVFGMKQPAERPKPAIGA